MKVNLYSIYIILGLFFTSCSMGELSIDDPSVFSCSDYIVEDLKDYNCSVTDFSKLDNNTYEVLNTVEGLKEYVSSSCQSLNIDNTTVVIGKQEFTSEVVEVGQYVRRCEENDYKLVLNVILNNDKQVNSTIYFEHVLPFKVAEQDLSLRFTISE